MLVSFVKYTVKLDFILKKEKKMVGAMTSAKNLHSNEGENERAAAALGSWNGHRCRN